MKKNPDDRSFDKARERLSQFEMARSPQMTSDELFDGLDELVAKLESKKDALTDQAAIRLKLLKARILLLEGKNFFENNETQEE